MNTLFLRPQRWSGLSPARSFSLFSRTPSLNVHKSDLARAIASKNPQALHAPYVQITQYMRDNPGNPNPLSSQQLVDILSILSSSNLSSNFILLRTVFNDLGKIFSTEATPFHRHLLLRGFCRALRAEDAFEWIQDDMYKDSSTGPSTADCNLVLEAFMNRSPNDANKVIDYMEQKGIPRSAETYILLFKLYFEQLQDIDKIEQVKRELDIEHDDIKTDSMVLAALLDGYGAWGNFDSA